MPVLAFSRSLVSGSREVPFARRCVGRIVDFGEGMNRWFARWYSREAFEVEGAGDLRVASLWVAEPRFLYW